MHTKIVTVLLTGCALVSCADVQQAPDLIGKSHQLPPPGNTIHHLHL